MRHPEALLQNPVICTPRPQVLSIVPKTAYRHSRAGGNPGGWRGTSFLCEPTLERPCPLVSPLDKNMGALIHLHMSSWIDSTLNRRQTVASAKKGFDRASSSSLKQPKRVQRVQMACRNDFQKCTRSQSWTAPHSALAGAAGAAGAGILKKLFRSRSSRLT